MREIEIKAKEDTALERLSEETNTMLVRGLRVILGLLLVGVCAYAAGQITLDGPIYPTLFVLQLTQAFIVLAALRSLRRQAARQRIIPIGIATFSIVYITVAAAGVVSGGESVTALLFCALAIGTAALLPWGYRPQLFTVAVAGLALLGNVYFISAGDLSRSFVLGNIAIIAAVLVATVVVAARFQHYREELVHESLRREEAEKSLRDMDAEVERRVAERTSDLESTNRDLESFGYTISHDLHAPLRSICAFATTLMEDYSEQLGPDGMEQVSRVQQGTKRMQQLVDGLLELSRIGRGDLKIEHVDLSDTARQVLADLEASSPPRQVDVSIADGIYADGDAGMLQSVMINLIGNAWKYSAKNPRAEIEFGLSTRDGRPAYFVRDNGVGFSMDNRERVFEPFQRLHKESDYEGVGVGLTTAARVIERHGGRLWAESEIGKGATFYFTISPPDEAA